MQLFKRFLRSDQWRECYFILEYPTLKCFKEEGVILNKTFIPLLTTTILANKKKDLKPIDEFELRQKSEDSDDEDEAGTDPFLPLNGIDFLIFFFLNSHLLLVENRFC